jgi:hypothetical protein
MPVKGMAGGEIGCRGVDGDGKGETVFEILRGAVANEPLIGDGEGENEATVEGEGGKPGVSGEGGADPG